MAIIQVINLETDEVVNTINAEMGDECPEGCYFKDITEQLKLPELSTGGE